MAGKRLQTILAGPAAPSKDGTCCIGSRYTMWAAGAESSRTLTRLIVGSGIIAGAWGQECSHAAKGSLIEMPAGTPVRNAVEDNAIELPRFAGKSLAEERIEAAYEMWRLLSSKNLSGIARLFREAIDLDPRNASGYAGLAHALIAQGLIGELSLATAYSSARTAAEAALKLDAGSSEALCVRAWLKMTSDRDWEGARKIFDELLSSNPANTRIMVGRALLSIVYGDPHAASELLYAASEHARLSSLSLGLHSWSEYLAADYSEVLEHIDEARASGRSGPILGAVEALTSIQVERTTSSIAHIELLLAQDPRNDVIRGALGYLAGLSGDKAKARAVLQCLTGSRSHARNTPHYAIGLAFLGLDQKQEAARSILSSFEEGSLWSVGFHLDPILRGLEEEAEFRDAVRAGYPSARSREGILASDVLQGQVG